MPNIKHFESSLRLSRLILLSTSINYYSIETSFSIYVNRLCSDHIVFDQTLTINGLNLFAPRHLSIEETRIGQSRRQRVDGRTDHRNPVHFPQVTNRRTIRKLREKHHRDLLEIP